MPFTAPTAANKSRASSYQLLNPTALSSFTSRQAGEYFAYRSVLQFKSKTDNYRNYNPNKILILLK
jgi:hypothetical protein